ncbi:MAG: lamin tail domain-containing protein, partial [Planctomycetes bacterium]|nr:lamin tail domain-containing protein [Planctomycetota bacterium]
MKKLMTTLVLSALWVAVSVSAAQVLNEPVSGLTLSEFAAVNDRGFSTLVEGIDTWSDWIEIHNASAASQNLEGWYLTDDPENLALWALPTIQIEPQGHLIVWASGVLAEDHPENWPYVDELGYLHTNFKLAGEGGYLALVSPDLRVVHEYANHEIAEDVWGYPPQKEGVSYGLCSGQPMFLPLPTPGLANQPACVAQCEDPVVSHVN